MVKRGSGRWLLATACGCVLALLLAQRQPAVDVEHSALQPPSTTAATIKPALATSALTVDQPAAPAAALQPRPAISGAGAATKKTGADPAPNIEAAATVRRDAFDAAVERLQTADSDAADLSLANAIEAVWRTALDAQTPAEALPLIADWATHADPAVAERAAAAVESLRQAQQPSPEPATPPTLGHERLRDLALNSPHPEVRYEAIVELALIKTAEASRWLAIAATLETDPANQSLLHQLNEQ